MPNKRLSPQRKTMARPCAVFCALLFTLAQATWVHAWKFGILGDTQWGIGDDGKSPNGVPAGIITQINKAFIEEKVAFVIQVGDLSEYGYDGVVPLGTRATYVQELYNAGIGFFPLRGNHDFSEIAAREFVRIFPQTRDGSHNRTPLDAFNYTDSANTHPAARRGNPFSAGAAFSSPGGPLAGLSYSFSYANARFVLLDQFTGLDGAEATIAGQMPWISREVINRPVGSHAFVFGHKGIITVNHADNLFGYDPSADPGTANAFISLLAGNGVRYYFGGHDHLLNRAFAATTDGATAIQEVTLAAAGYKFYLPLVPANDSLFNLPVFGRTRQTEISQELNTIAYYIVTVDSQRVAVDCWSAQPPGINGGMVTTTPDLTGLFQKRESFGYGLNGKTFAVAQKQSYSGVVDSSSGTVARILGGTNTDTARDFNNRPLSNAVWTAWRAADQRRLIGRTLSLWGMSRTLQKERVAPFALSLSYGPIIPLSRVRNGRFGLYSKRTNGVWVNAVERNFGGRNAFKFGPWTPADTLGAFGVDTLHRRVWAVVNYNGDFSVGDIAHYSEVAENILPVSRSAGRIKIFGSMLILPRTYEGKTVEVVISDLQGRTLLCRTIVGNRLMVTGTKGGMRSSPVIVRCRSGGLSLVQKIVL